MPYRNTEIKTVDAVISFNPENTGFISLKLVSEGEVLDTFTIQEFIDNENMFSVEPIKNVIDEIYDTLNLKLHENGTLDEDSSLGYTRGKKEKFEIAWTNSLPYMQTIMDIYEENEVNRDVAYLCFIESLFNTDAHSSSNAYGIFQMIPETARNYGLIVNKNIDERRDPLLSAEASSKYINKLYNQFDHWLWAINAYHSGEKNLDNALKWAMTYYPKEPNDFEGSLRDYQYSKVVSEFPKDREFNNLELKYGNNSARYTTQFLAFLETKNTYKKDFLPLPFKPIKVKYKNAYDEKITINVESGDTLSKISYNYGITIEDIMKENNLSSSIIKIGQALVLNIEKPPLKFKDIISKYPSSLETIDFLYKYNFSYTFNKPSREEFINSSIYSNSTLNVPIEHYQEIEEIINSY